MRRIDDEHDFVRLELEAALQRDIRVIPILVDGAQLPRVEQLPQGLQGLARRQALKVTHEHFRSIADRLVADVERLYPQARSKGESSSTYTEASRPALSHSVSEALKPTVDVLTSGARLIKLSIRLQHSHLIVINDETFFGTIMVDGDVIVKVSLYGAHAFELRDGNRILQGVLEITTATWEMKFSRVVVKIDGDVIYAA